MTYPYPILILSYIYLFRSILSEKYDGSCLNGVVQSLDLEDL